MEVDVTTITNTACNDAYGDGEITDSMVCARDDGKDACQGDSGGKTILILLNMFQMSLTRSSGDHGAW